LWQSQADRLHGFGALLASDNVKAFVLQNIAQQIDVNWVVIYHNDGTIHN